MTSGDATGGKGGARAERIEREAAALRENLKRRKLQARARREVPADCAETGKADGKLAEKRGKP